MSAISGLNELSAVAAAADIEAGRISSEQLTRACLERIAERDGRIGAWAYLAPEQSIAEARARDRGRRRGLLHGVPIAVKDIIDTADMPTGYGTPIYQGNRPACDAVCVSGARAEGAVVLGKAVTTELANIHPAGTRNPRAPGHTPGGSSSGSAAAVADCMAPLALGTQTGGSLIRPASYCGVVGYKPTFDFISTAGVKALSASLDTVGVYGRSVPDVALFGRAVIGLDAVDFDTKPAAAPRIGLYRTPQWPLAEAPMASAFEEGAGRLARAGARVVQVTAPPLMDEIVYAAEAISDYETYRSLAFERMHHAERLSPSMTRKLDKAAAATRARYLAALKTAGHCRRLLKDMLRDLDVLVTPSATGEAPAGLGAIGPTGGGTALSAFQAMWTALHAPAISVPVFTGPQGLPIGLQIIAPRRADERALLWAHWVHRALT
jgi:Asp-tRNA(Asn)/Glu-tRNA(Gln) amidotransferase A subunit family amidase